MVGVAGEEPTDKSPFRPRSQWDPEIGLGLSRELASESGQLGEFLLSHG